MLNKFIKISGGSGRVLCAIPAIEKLSKKCNIIIQTTNPWVFENNPNITTNLSYNIPAWHRYIKNSEYITPEPYHNHLYYTQKHHLIQSFDYLLNNETEMRIPKLYLTENEKIFGRETIERYKEKYECDKIVVLQPFGATTDSKFNDSTGRSIPYNFTLKLSKLLSSHNILVLIMMDLKDEELSNIPNVVSPMYTSRNWASLFNFVDYFIGCDSLGQHMARAFGIPGTIFLGQTYKENISYPDHFDIVQDERFPQEYYPFRIEEFLSLADPFIFLENKESEILNNIINKIVPYKYL